MDRKICITHTYSQGPQGYVSIFKAHMPCGLVYKCVCLIKSLESLFNNKLLLITIQLLPHKTGEESYEIAKAFVVQVVR